MASITKARITENSAVVLLARLVDATGTPVVQADVTSLTFKVFDNSDGTQTGTGTLVVSDTILNAPATNNIIWPYDDGYNFEAELDGSNFPEGDSTYQVEIHVTPAVGDTYYVLWQLTTYNIWTE